MLSRLWLPLAAALCFLGRQQHLAVAQYIEYDQLNASDHEPNDQFGFAIDMQNTTIVVSALGHTGGAESQQTTPQTFDGAVYVYGVNQTTLKLDFLEKFVTPETDATDPRKSGQFGRVVKLVQDKLFISAPGHDFHGVVFIYQYDEAAVTANDGSPVFTLIQSLRPEDLGGRSANSEASFGKDFDITSDLKFLAVGATTTSDILSQKGAVYVYEFAEGSGEYEFLEKLEVTDGVVGDQLGTCVVIDDTAILGGASETAITTQDGRIENVGTIYLFQDDGSSYMLEETVNAKDLDTDDRFGATCAMIGPRVLVGVSFDDRFVNITQDENPPELRGDVGSIYFLHRTAAGLTLQDIIVPEDLTGLDQFGYTIKMLGTQFLTSAPFHDVDDLEKAGAVYLYEDLFGTGDYEIVQKLTPLEPEAGGAFGTSVTFDPESEFFAIGSFPDLTVEGVREFGKMYLFGVDVGTNEPSAPPSEPPSNFPTEGFEICSPIYKCECGRFPFSRWPFCRGPKTYMHRYTHPTNKAGEDMNCITRCVDEDRALARLQDLSSDWKCGTCLF